MKSITQDTQNDKKISASILNFFKKYRVSSALKSANAYKTKGFSVIDIFRYLFCLIFTNRSMYMNMLMDKQEAGFGKDTVYRFINSLHINWLRFTTILTARIIQESILDLTDENRVNVFIIDDSMFERASSKKVELLAKTFDHAKHAFQYGFRMLTLGWTDGNTFLPVNSVLLSTENKKNRVNESKSVDKRSVGFKRRTFAQTKATTVMLDSWFTSPASLLAVKEIGYDVIAMAKKTPKMHYLYQGKMQSLPDIYKQNKKRRGRSRYLLSVEVTVCKDGQSIPAKVIYVRNRNKRKDYLCLICTDMNMSEEEVIRTYGKRWEIEVFFKVCKSYLKLSKECQSLSYDAMTAHVAIVFTRYMMLAVENRKETDVRTLGEIFYYLSDELADIGWIQAFHLLMNVFLDTLSDKLFLTTKQLNEFMEAFLSALPKELVRCLPKIA